jgi:ABC-type phosphate transport system auxiliary subunit
VPLNLAVAPADTRSVNVILTLGVLLVVAALGLLAWAFPRV